jgi:hypothetical protein
MVLPIAICDLLSTVFMFIALVHCSVSILQMLRVTALVMTAWMSCTFLKNKLYFHHYASITSIVFGAVIVACVGIFTVAESQNETQTKPFGIIMVVFAMTFRAIKFVNEESVLKKTQAHPLIISGSEGFWGVIIIGIMLPFMQYVKCNSDLCSFRVLEDTKLAVSQLQADPNLLTLTILLNIAYAS